MLVSDIKPCFLLWVFNFLRQLELVIDIYLMRDICLVNGDLSFSYFIGQRESVIEEVLRNKATWVSYIVTSKSCPSKRHLTCLITKVSHSKYRVT